MVDKSFPIFACILLLLLCLVPFFCHHEFRGGEQKPFKFIENLQGRQKGETVRGIHELKLYLRRFGYLDDHHKPDDHFDDVLESSIKTYQENYNLKSTGILDLQTVREMRKPRCGVPDIVNGTTRMRSSGKQHQNHKTFHTVSHYSFFSGSPKWPETKTHLTYSISPRVDLLSPAIGQAFAKWSSVSHFTFEEIQDRDVNKTDIKISFLTGDHGDGNPFDGPGGVLAHSFAPTVGTSHFDGDEKWSTSLVAGSVDLETTAMHEIGHLLGLGHSSVVDAIMYPTTEYGVRKVDLKADDIQGIRALYNLTEFRNGCNNIGSEQQCFCVDFNSMGKFVSS